VIFEIDNEVLDLEHRHMLAKVLANLSAGYAGLAEKEAQSALRKQIDSRPNPTPQSVIDRAKQDRTTVYVPGIRGGRRVITLGVAPAVEPPPEVKPEPAPVPPPPPLTWFEKLQAWIMSFPFPKEPQGEQQ
jgi:hypothetical protein